MNGKEIKERWAREMAAYRIDKSSPCWHAGDDGRNIGCWQEVDVVADYKKVQTMINVAADELETIRAALARLQVVRGKFDAANPSLTGTALYGKKTALADGLAALQAEADQQLWTDLIAARVPSHRGEAL